MKYIKYIVAIIIGFIGYCFFKLTVMKYAQVFLGNCDSAMILQAIYLLAGLIIGCTALIIFVIKEHSNRFEN
jgi:hypothetical protein